MIKYFFEMANKGKNKTGLPINIYLSIKPQNKKENIIGVKLQNNYADKFDMGDLIELIIFIDKNFEYSIINKQKLKISNKDIEKSVGFIKLNIKMILDYWNGNLDSGDIDVNIKKLDKE